MIIQKRFLINNFIKRHKVLKLNNNALFTKLNIINIKFDIKSKKVLDGEKKYYLADLSIYYAMNTDNRIHYGPVLENVLYSYLKTKGYSLSVGKIGSLECDFIARRGVDEYFYIQVSKNIDDDKTAEREYKPFYQIKEMYPRYLFVADFVLQKNVEGIKNVNIVDFIYEKKDLT